jgi:hypothetical protein
MKYKKQYSDIAKNSYVKLKNDYILYALKNAWHTYIYIYNASTTGSGIKNKVMRVIWKFNFETKDEISVSMPKDAKILSLQTQNEIPCMWALVDPTAPKEERKFTIFGTGHHIADVLGEFVGTYQLHGGRLVFHVFESK